MARSQVVWLAVAYDGTHHAFTVKHELIRWLRRTTISIEWVERIPDGGDKQVQTFDPLELMGVDLNGV